MLRVGQAAPGDFSSAELYARAVDDLAGRSALRRTGALHTLEMIGNAEPHHRPAIVDLVCAYLRTPYDATGPADERAVRAAAQRVLAARLRGDDTWREDPRHWRTGLDLSGATLVDLDLSGCVITGPCRFGGATFLGPVRFPRTVFVGAAYFDGAVFTDHAWFEGTVFHDEARFDAAEFLGDAWFGQATFGGRAGFAAVEFGGHAWFGGVVARGLAEFSGSAFRRSAGFRGGVFSGGAALLGTTFVGPARVSRRYDDWNLCPVGWKVEVDPNNWAVGRLLPEHSDATVFM